MVVETSLVTEDSSGKTLLVVIFSSPSSQHAVQSGVQEAVVVAANVASVREAWRLASALVSSVAQSSSSVAAVLSSSVAVWSSVVAALLAVSSILVRRLVFS